MISKAKIKYINSLAYKKYRDQDKVFIAEGPKLISELENCFELVEKFEGDDADKLSLLNTPQQALAIFRQREDNINKVKIAPSELYLMLSDIQNPGNLGTIIRLADWFGIEHIFCSTGCADIYNPKTVQATMGAIARVNVHYCDLLELLNSLTPSNPQNPQNPQNSQNSQKPQNPQNSLTSYPIYGTFLNGENVYDSELTEGGIIIMGNEGHGIPAELAEKVNRRLLIPNYPIGRDTSESLNVAVATAIICSEFRRRCK